ncbi:MAG: hypothetical protein LQ349_003498 [Xanthoria aureola]|nr:MAG: hypothetical protein LQ349_003498 [Xanthoria aureola]
MPRLEDAQQTLLPSNLKARTQNAWDDFTDFALRDNVLEVAVGLILASAFTTVVSSFVDDIILPPVSLISPSNNNLDAKFAVLRGRGPYATLKDARADGAVVMAYGEFISKIIRLFVIALALFVIARAYGWAADDSVIKKQVKCKYCRKRISEKAKRCVNCTSWQDGREG